MDRPKDDLKWFGEGFDGFPNRLPEDCVEYMLFIVNKKLKQRELLSRLEEVRREALDLTKRLLKDYIWQRDDFNLNSETCNEAGLRYLHGFTNYGDSVEDEWLIVYLLRELSKRFSDLWIKVVDTDGEFLLIEAASALPRWINPEIADNRVWINDDKLRVIPLVAAQASSADPKTNPISRPLTITEAIQCITSSPEILIRSPLIEAEAFYRLSSYPEHIQTSLHHARITIPRKLAYILHNFPASIAPAVEAFYLRDPVALKALRKEPSALVLPPDNLITTSVRFTRVLYAKLKSQHFSAPDAWKPSLAKAEKSVVPDAKKQTDYTQLETGMKVTSGYEMLLTDALNQNNRSVREIQILLEDLKQGTALPTDEEVNAWPNGKRVDDEGWLDINFEDFGKELQGNAREARNPGLKGAFGPDPPSGFGDAKTQADLRKMVQRFEEFLNDENSGIDGAELDDTDVDDDEEEAGGDSDDEDKHVSFNEKEFARMMREMMGMPPEEVDETSLSTSGRSRSYKEGANNDLDGENEGEELRKVMQRIEAELDEAGILDLDPTPSKLTALRPTQDGGINAAETTKNYMEKQNWEDESEEEIDIDFNLAKNLLESFKSQAGMAGPGGNLMGMMGIQIPRDEDELQPSVGKP